MLRKRFGVEVVKPNSASLVVMSYRVGARNQSANPGSNVSLPTPQDPFIYSLFMLPEP
jgi:hypothetical protein